MYKLIILYFLFFINFSPLNANEITFSISDYWRESNTSADHDKFLNEYSSDDPFAYTIGIKNWKNGILNKQKSVYLKKFHLLYTLEYSRANAILTGRAGIGSSKTRFSNELYELYISRKLNNKLKLFIGYGYKRIKFWDLGHTSTTGFTPIDTHLKYWYHPIGFIYEISPRWLFKSQYNLWNHGQIQEVNNLATKENHKKWGYDYGWGLDFNISKKITNKFSLFTFYKFWDVDDSNSGLAIYPLDWPNPDHTSYPKSVSEEIGIGISYKF